MTHKLKILPKWYDDVLNERKKFEVRKNDRDFKVGDKLLLQEWENGIYTGREILKEIEYIYHGDGAYGLSEKYCILGLKPNTQTADDVVEVKHGKWAAAHDTSGHDYERCTECGIYIEGIFFANDYDVNFCPNCGADMRERKETE